MVKNVGFFIMSSTQRLSAHLFLKLRKMAIRSVFAENWDYIQRNIPVMNKLFG